MFFAKKLIFPPFFIFIIFPLLVVSCASTSVKESSTQKAPDWLTSDVNSVYNENEHIAAVGEGYSTDLARNDALNKLSMYFETTVRSEGVAKRVTVNSSFSSSSEQTISVTSNMKLFGVKFTEAFYLKKEKKYYCVAYIDRKDAWARYESEIKNARDIFISYYENAVHEVEPINKIKLLGDAQKTGEDFREKLVFANILSKDLTQKTYGKDEQLLSSIPSMIKKEQVSNPVYISVDDDNAGAIESAIRKIFSNLGFVVSGSVTNASYTAKAEVNYNKASGTTRIVLNPYITLSLKGKNGSVYAFSAESEKVVAPNEQTAKEIAAQDITEIIQQKLEADIKNTLGL